MIFCFSSADDYIPGQKNDAQISTIAYRNLLFCIKFFFPMTLTPTILQILLYSLEIFCAISALAGWIAIISGISFSCFNDAHCESAPCFLLSLSSTMQGILVLHHGGDATDGGSNSKHLGSTYSKWSTAGLYDDRLIIITNIIITINVIITTNSQFFDYPKHPSKMRESRQLLCNNLTCV